MRACTIMGTPRLKKQRRGASGFVKEKAQTSLKQDGGGVRATFKSRPHERRVSVAVAAVHHMYEICVSRYMMHGVPKEFRKSSPHISGNVCW
jgi:hypothetical protein